MGDVIRFYAACLKRAFEGWFKRVEGWTSSVALLVGVGLLVAHVSPKVQSAATLLPSYFFLGAALLLGSYRLIRAPYSLYREQRDAKEELEQAREPKLEIRLPDPPVINSISLRGGTNESLSGTRQTVTTGWEMDVVALLCRNAGATTAKGCRARILSVTRMTESGPMDVGVVESVDLPWRKDDPEDSHVIDIPPSDTRRVWIGGVRSLGHIWLFRNVKSLPIEYQQLLGPPGAYRVLIQVEGENIPPQQVLIDIEGAEGPRPERGIQRGRASVSLIAQGAPCIVIEPKA